MEILAFSAFLALFTITGFLSRRRHQLSNTEYLLANRDIPPIMIALSAAASKYSGYMFIGLMGYIYSHGLSAVWIICGLLFGDAVTFFFVHKKLRIQAEQTQAHSYAELISKWGGRDAKWVRLAIAVLSLIFLMTYAAAQFNAGGKALFAVFDWPTYVGTILGAVFIMTYCVSGGLRASIWTDTLQAVLMIVSLMILLGSSLQAIGGWNNYLTALNEVSPSFLDWGEVRFGSFSALFLFALGWMFNGIGVIGQPHIMVRFMALDRAEHMMRATGYYIAWSTAFLALALGVGLATRLFIDPQVGFDAELALPRLAQALLPAFAVGVILGGVFAAVMSTTDSQILSCSAVFSEDFKLGNTPKAKWLITGLVTLGSLIIALFASSSVFSLVILAWSALASTLGPTIILLALGCRPSQGQILVLMGLGLGSVLLWRHFGLSAYTYEGFPGLVVPLVGYAVMAGITKLYRKG